MGQQQSQLLWDVNFAKQTINDFHPPGCHPSLPRLFRYYELGFASGVFTSRFLDFRFGELDFPPTVQHTHLLDDVIHIGWGLVGGDLGSGASLGVCNILVHRLPAVRRRPRKVVVQDRPNYPR